MIPIEINLIMLTILFLYLDFDNMCDDSSSEDEITKRILEDSIDTELLTNDLFADSSTKRPLDEIKS